MNREWKQEIKYMEEMSLNAWPSYRVEFYDGWLLRYSHNYTYRTNAVEQIGESTIPLEEKLRYCERIYGELNCPVNYKIQPLLDPEFDQILEKRGYEIRHTTDVMTMEIGDFNMLLPSIEPITATNQTVIWYSSNPKVASVDLMGSITALAGGTTQITAVTSNRLKASCTVTVSRAPLRLASAGSYTQIT